MYKQFPLFIQVGIVYTVLVVTSNRLKIIKMRYIICIFILCNSSFSLCAQDKVDSIYERNNLSILNLSATDALGRRIEVAKQIPDQKKYVGVFYSVWLGQHNSQQRDVYDIQQLINTNPSALNNPKGSPESPLNEFHFWSEPLYGYYSMSDPWIVTRHIELLTNAAIDYICIDATNNVVYESSTLNLLNTLLKFQQQGFAVPKVVFYTNSSSGTTVNTLYNKFYSSGMYETLWFKPQGKPMIIGITEKNGKASDQTRYEETLHPPNGFTAFIKPEMKTYFDVRESQWPNGEYNEHSIPWMSWQYPQWNHNGTVAVPVAQHSHTSIAASSMDPESSRGYNNATKKVEPDWTAGTNFQTMWNTVLESKDKVDNVLVTSFNEWMAIKYVDDIRDVFFVDVYNNEFSRDIEMMKGGYKDNFYLQLVQNTRKFKYAEGTNTGQQPLTTIDIETDNGNQWRNVQAIYTDFEGDALPRNFTNAAGTYTYIDNSNRNDIIEIKVAHDKKNLYFRIKTSSNISPYNGSDLNWMNILISTKGDENFEGYQYIINRKPDKQKTSVEKSIGGYNWIASGDAKYIVKGNLMEVSIPLKYLGLSPDDCTMEFKVADNVSQYDDIMDYYVTGDSAPIGRLNFSYGK